MAALRQSTRQARVAAGHGRTTAYWLGVARRWFAEYPDTCSASARTAERMAVDSAVRAGHWGNLALNTRATERRQK